MSSQNVVYVVGPDKASLAASIRVSLTYPIRSERPMVCTAQEWIDPARLSDCEKTRDAYLEECRSHAREITRLDSRVETLTAEAEEFRKTIARERDDRDALFKTLVAVCEAQGLHCGRCMSDADIVQAAKDFAADHARLSAAVQAADARLESSMRETRQVCESQVRVAQERDTAIAEKAQSEQVARELIAKLQREREDLRESLRQARSELGAERYLSSQAAAEVERLQGKLAAARKLMPERGQTRMSLGEKTGDILIASLLDIGSTEWEAVVKAGLFTLDAQINATPGAAVKVHGLDKK